MIYTGATGATGVNVNLFDMSYVLSTSSFDAFCFTLLYPSLSCYQLLFLLYFYLLQFFWVSTFIHRVPILLLFLKAPVLFLLYIVRVPICFRANSVHVYAMVVSVRIPRMASHKAFHSCTSTILIAQDHSCSLIVQNNKLFFRQD